MAHVYIGFKITGANFILNYAIHSGWIPKDTKSIDKNIAQTIAQHIDPRMIDAKVQVKDYNDYNGWIVDYDIANLLIEYIKNLYRPGMVILYLRPITYHYAHQILGHCLSKHLSDNGRVVKEKYIIDAKEDIKEALKIYGFTDVKLDLFIFK